MKKNIFLSIIMASCLGFVGCDENKWLERDPQGIITEQQTWNDPAMLKALIANYYDRLPALQGLFNSGAMCEIDDAMWTGHMDRNGINDFDYGNDYASEYVNWDDDARRFWKLEYMLIRDINLALDNVEKYGTALEAPDKAVFIAELRFIRASVYFELVKRMGGVPIVTTQLLYTAGSDPTPLQLPRAKEYEVYDFVYKELEEIKEDLKGNKDSQTRASYYTALALESRAMLYAASIAKYNNEMAAPITLPGGEVGIPAEKAEDYYTKSLAASREIMNSGQYELYAGNPDKGENFYDMLNKKTREVIFAKDYKTGDKSHYFTYDNIVKTMTEDNESSSTISPSLNLAESFDYLDGTKGTFKYKDASGNYITYSNISDIYSNKDARFYGTIIYPGTTFKSKAVRMQAGVAVWDNGHYTMLLGTTLGQSYGDGVKAGDGKLQTGVDGPLDGAADVSNTGFYLRKMVSDASAASTRGTRATNWWPWFRLGEIYLNAAEAAFELNDQGSALSYINKLREVHGGFPANSLASITIDKIRNERRIELAFEDHRFFDLKRWRIAHLVWDGKSTNEDAMVYGLFQYRVVRPGHPDDGKYIFDKIKPTRFKRARYFRMANYYSAIPQAVIDKNPKLVKNPFH